MRGPQPPADTLSKRRLKTWIRLLGLTRSVEAALREHLRTGHATTLPRFDVMAALWRRREGVAMSELGRMLLVSNGNVTAVVDRLERDALARRTPSAADRRTIHVALTEAGLAQFEAQAAGHEARLNELLSGLGEADLEALGEILRRAGRGGGG